MGSTRPAGRLQSKKLVVCHCMPIILGCTASALLRAQQRGVSRDDHPWGFSFRVPWGFPEEQDQGDAAKKTKQPGKLSRVPSIGGREGGSKSKQGQLGNDRGNPRVPRRGLFRLTGSTTEDHIVPSPVGIPQAGLAKLFPSMEQRNGSGKFC
jgi:hypothetical protein